MAVETDALATAPLWPTVAPSQRTDEHAYRGQLDELDLAMIAYRHRAPERPGRANSNNGISVACECGPLASAVALSSQILARMKSSIARGRESISAVCLPPSGGFHAHNRLGIEHSAQRSIERPRKQQVVAEPIVHRRHRSRQH